MLDFLPDKLNLSGSVEEIFRDLYTIFSTDIKSSSFRYNGLPVIFDKRITDSLNYEEGFWHIITRGKGEDRSLDFKRAKRLPWLKPLVLNSDADGVYKWLEEKYDKKGRFVKKTHIWYREGKYLIVLIDISNKYFLATAFYVSGRRNDSYYYRKYQQAKKKGPEV